jgi:hypothetical protein
MNMQSKETFQSIHVSASRKNTADGCKSCSITPSAVLLNLSQEISTIPGFCYLGWTLVLGGEDYD